MRNIDHAKENIKGWALWVDRTALRLTALTEEGRSSTKGDWRDEYWNKNFLWSGRQEVMVAQPEAQKVAVEIHITGAQLTVTVNGKKYAFATPLDSTGFYGLAFHGAGYAAVKSLQIESGN